MLFSFPSSTEARRFARVLYVLSTFSFLFYAIRILSFVALSPRRSTPLPAPGILPLACACCRSGGLLWLVACILRVCCLDPCTTLYGASSSSRKYPRIKSNKSVSSGCANNFLKLPFQYPVADLAHCLQILTLQAENMKVPRIASLLIWLRAKGAPRTLHQMGGDQLSCPPFVSFRATPRMVCFSAFFWCEYSSLYTLSPQAGWIAPLG